MEAQPVDPRDIKWQVGAPAYRVYFWDQAAAPPGVPPERMGWRLESMRLTSVRDVDEVLEWARAPERPSRRFVVYAEVTNTADPGLVWLLGDDPTVSDDPRAKQTLTAERPTE